MPDTCLPDICFRGQLRPSQAEVARIASEKLAKGKRRLHIVAPPGSGKTVMGLYIWAELVGKPALVLSPNSAIQAQWAARTELFEHRHGMDLAPLISTDPLMPGLLTSLTYQSVTLPARATEFTEARATDLWAQSLIAKNQAACEQEAEDWIEGLRGHNPQFYNERLAYFRKQIREEDAIGGRAMTLLHRTSLDTLVRLRDYGVGLLILDECHHLMGHWGRVLAEVSEYLDGPVIVGLTATPPDREGKKREDTQRYDDFFGKIDFEVPVPAVVKDGYLAPYQDLAYFVRPSEKELAFIASADQQFRSLIDELCQANAISDAPGSLILRPPESLTDWLVRVLRDLQLPTRQASQWRPFFAADPRFVTAAVWFLNDRNIALPENVPELLPSDDPEEERLIILIDRYTRHYLRRSPHTTDHETATRVVDRLRMLGVQITDSGPRACASPVSRVIAYTRNKTQAVVPILRHEAQSLGQDLRAVVIADFEKSSAIRSEVAHLLDEEAGGAVAAFRMLLDDPETNALDPVLVTGSSVLVDADLEERVLGEANQWLQVRSIDVELSSSSQGMFHELNGRGSDWCPRIYVELITELFQRGTTRCLVGTRGLLGEGWDANSVNVLVDLSTATTSMTVNQLRGRSLRLDPNHPRKLSNNWDIVCIAPEFSKGLDDYRRFLRKHETIFGVCDDGAIEKGVGHVHAAFTELKPELVDGSVSQLNSDMLHRAANREAAYELWQIGKSYSGQPIRAVEIGSHQAKFTEGFPPFAKAKRSWDRLSLVTAISEAVFASLQETSQISATSVLKINPRDGGYVRVFLVDASAEEARIFAQSVRETLGPLSSPRYVIPRSVDIPADTLTNRLLPRLLRPWLERRDRLQWMLHAVPTVLASKRDLAAVFEKHWNARVSPGQAMFVKNEQGEQLVIDAIRNNLSPATIVHEKEMFL
ncbi:DEAD/DEAH box helicase [Novipirellula caenicola]|uniref:Helicase ATP-binding domain-containing protein n=1 Tax=Novipirellula caenicola TaxID=1536901 RepID=A0ABP9VSI5_9BACT